MVLPHKDSRLFERFAVHLPIKFKGDLDEREDRLFLHDVSAQGAKLLSKERFYIHDYVSLEVLLPHERSPLSLHGQVVWMSAVEPNALWKVGLSFEEVNFMALRRLYRYWNDEKTLPY